MWLTTAQAFIQAEHEAQTEVGTLYLDLPACRTGANPLKEGRLGDFAADQGQGRQNRMGLTAHYTVGHGQTRAAHGHAGQAAQGHALEQYTTFYVHA